MEPAHHLLDFLIRPLQDDPIYKDRLARELALIDRNNFVDCFLQVIEILSLSRDIPHIVRGSAGSSLLCYLLGITNFDPIAEGIPLARFMHEFRQDQPDIDIDFPHDQRDEVVERIRQRYPNRVARISNHIKYRYESALREIIRRHGHRKFLPKHFDLRKLFGEEEASAIELEASELAGQHRGDSLHCGGIIIFDGEVPEHLISKPGQIHLDKDEVEKAGLIKIDLLCNRGLAQARDCSALALEDYPDRDPATLELLCNADTVGVTYGESPTMRKALRAIQPTCRADLALALALIRPAAASRGRKAAFMENWRRRREQSHLVYDDDAILLIQKLLGCDEGRADVYRRGFSKGKEEMIREVARQLGDRSDREQILEDLGMMRNYSFCKSHAISYSYLVYALAYNKVHEPLKFWQAALNHACSMYRPWVHTQEAKKAGLKLTPGNRPWVLCGDTLVNPGRQINFLEDGWEQYRKRGYWSSNRFMPGMGHRIVGDRLEFRGLIATHRIYPMDSDCVTFCTVGTGPSYWDLIINGAVNLDLADGVEGWGYIQDVYGSLNVQVQEYKPLSA